MTFMVRNDIEDLLSQLETISSGSSNIGNTARKDLISGLASTQTKETLAKLSLQTGFFYFGALRPSFKVAAADFELT
jgi:hypothetical protein